jgi:hypothetical protein
VSFFLLHLVLDTGDIKITNLREDNITISRQRGGRQSWRKSFSGWTLEQTPS